MKKLICSILFLSFLIFTFFWYGLFSEVGKSVKEPYDWTNIDSSSLAVGNDFYSNYQKYLSTTAISTVIDSLYEYASYQAHTLYTDPENQYFYLTHIDDTLGYIVQELSKRNNAAKMLLAAYQSTHMDFKDTELDGVIVGRCAILELLLAQPTFQNHLTAEDKEYLLLLANQKQQEKFLNPNYKEYYAKRNYLYTDTYNENGWIEEKLEARATSFKDCRENPDIYFRKQKQITQMKTDSYKSFMRISFRFDNCQITQP